MEVCHAIFLWVNRNLWLKANSDTEDFYEYFLVK
jgi:hypothetical protein